MTEDTDRYSRNIALFGELGQRKIRACRVGVIGLGGLGSHCVQQIALLGGQDFIFVDHDTVSLSNLNRLIGATQDDVLAKRTKVGVAERVVRSIHPSADIQIFATTIADSAAKDALRRAQILIGSVDNDAARLVLTEFAAAHRIPYLDLASDTGEEGGLWYGGRVLFAFDGSKCLSCSGELDQRQIARASMTPEQRSEDDKIYGVSTKSLSGTGPAVVSINGVVASLGVTEFMAWVTGLREPYSQLTYRGDLGRVTINKDSSPLRCYYCSFYRK